ALVAPPDAEDTVDDLLWFLGRQPGQLALALMNVYKIDLFSDVLERDGPRLRAMTKELASQLDRSLEEAVALHGELAEGRLIPSGTLMRRQNALAAAQLPAIRLHSG